MAEWEGVCVANVPDFVQGALEVPEHVLVALLEHLSLVLREVIHRRLLPLLLFLYWQAGGARRQPAVGHVRSLVRRALGHGRAPGLRQHAPVLLHLPGQARLHHALLRPGRLLQPRPQEPNHTLPVGAELAGGSLGAGLLAAPPRPGAQKAQATGHALPQQGRLGVLPQLLRVFEGADAGIEIAERHLGVGVDLIPVPVREVDMLRGRLAGRGGAQVRLARGGGREVRLAQVAQLAVQAGDERVLE